VIRTALLTGLVASMLALAAIPAQAAAVRTCAGVGSASGYKVVKLQASGVSCSKARAVVRAVAKDLRTTGGVDVPGASSFSLSTVICTGCGSTTTVISLGYASGGKVTISLRGGSGTSTPAPGSPSPASPSTGTGGGTIV